MSNGRSFVFGVRFEVFQKGVKSNFDVVVDDPITGRFPVGESEFPPGAEMLSSWVEATGKAIYGDKGDEPVDKPELAAKYIDDGSKIEGYFEDVHTLLLLSM